MGTELAFAAVSRKRNGLLEDLYTGRHNETPKKGVELLQDFYTLELDVGQVGIIHDLTDGLFGRVIDSGGGNGTYVLLERHEETISEMQKKLWRIDDGYLKPRALKLLKVAKRCIRKYGSRAALLVY